VFERKSVSYNWVIDSTHTGVTIVILL